MVLRVLLICARILILLMQAVLSLREERKKITSFERNGLSLSEMVSIPTPTWPVLLLSRNYFTTLRPRGNIISYELIMQGPSNRWNILTVYV